MKISTNQNNNYTTVNVKGALSVEFLHIFESSLRKASNDKKHTLVNLSQVSFLDSSALGVIIMHHRKLNRDDKKLILIDVPYDISQLFSITGLSKRIPIVNSMHEAIETIN
ncbi:MAG: STAS domain-containing protein [bacterium]|nr:STAS domain-containing protein [bacterium]